MLHSVVEMVNNDGYLKWRALCKLIACVDMICLGMTLTIGWSIDDRFILQFVETSQYTDEAIYYLVNAGRTMLLLGMFGVGIISVWINLLLINSTEMGRYRWDAAANAYAWKTGKVGLAVVFLGATFVNGGPGIYGALCVFWHGLMVVFVQEYIRELEGGSDDGHDSLMDKVKAV